MKASKIIERLESRFPNVMRGVQEASDQYSTYDFSNDLYLIEVKSRRKRYNPWLIEQHKVVANKEIADETGQQILYLSEYEGVASIWNINRLIQNKYDFGWTQKRMPCTTDFGARGWKLKDVGYLYEKDSKQINLID